MDVAEAVTLMADLGEAGEDEAEEAASAEEDAGDDAAAEGDGEEGETAEEAADEEAEAPAEGAMRPSSGAPRTRRPGRPCRPSCGRC